MKPLCKIPLDRAILCAECNQVTEGDGAFGCPSCGGRMLLHLARVISRIEDNLDLKVIWSSNEKLRPTPEDRSA